MGRLLRSDLMKMKSSRAFWVCCIVSLLLGALMSVLYYVVWMNLGESIEMTEQMMLSMGMPQETVSDTLSVVPSNNLWSYINTCLADTNVVYIIAVLIGVLAASEYSMGTFRNTLSRGFSRTQVYLSKFILCVIGTLITLFVYVLGGAVSAVIMFGFGSDTEAGQMLLQIGAYICLFIAIASFYLMIAVISKKTGTAIALSIIIPIVVQSAVTLLSMAFKDFGQISRYWLFNTVMATQGLCRDGEAYIPFLVAGIYMILCCTLGLIVFRKQEMK